MIHQAIYCPICREVQFSFPSSKNLTCKSCGAPTIHIIFRNITFSQKIKNLDLIGQIFLSIFCILILFLPFISYLFVSNLLFLMIYRGILIFTFFLGIYFQYLRAKQIKLHLKALISTATIPALADLPIVNGRKTFYLSNS